MHQLPATSITHMTLLVKNYQDALYFYVTQLGFSLIEREVSDDGHQWIRIAPPDQTNFCLILTLATTPAQLSAVGNQVGDGVLGIIQTTDCQAEANRLGSLGVEFSQLPVEQPYGWVAIFKDLYGNQWDLLQPLSQREL